MASNNPVNHVNEADIRYTLQYTYRKRYREERGICKFYLCVDEEVEIEKGYTVFLLRSSYHKTGSSYIPTGEVINIPVGTTWK